MLTRSRRHSCTWTREALLRELPHLEVHKLLQGEVLVLEVGVQLLQLVEEVDPHREHHRHNHRILHLSNLSSMELEREIFPHNPLREVGQEIRKRLEV